MVTLDSIDRVQRCTFPFVVQEFECALSLDNPVCSSGEDSIQVPLPEHQELYLIKFKDPHEKDRFSANIEKEMQTRE